MFFCALPHRADASPVDTNLVPGEGDHKGLTGFGKVRTYIHIFLIIFKTY